MSSRYKYTTMDRIFSRLDSLGIEYDEGTVVEWVGDALEYIGSVKSYEEDVCFAQVKNFSCPIPTWSHAIIQIARDGGISSSRGATVFTASVKEVLGTETITTDDGEVVTVDSEVSLANNVSLSINYKAWINSGYYRARFTPVRLKTSNFFNSIVCTEYNIPYEASTDEYTIINGDTLRFSFEEGLVAIAYLKQAIDKETGWPMIPDHISHTTAIVRYVIFMLASIDFMRNREGSKTRLDKAEADWHWYCKQAGNVDLMPYGDDEHQNLLDQRSYLLPRDKFYGFFGNLAKPELRRYNKPRGF